ncbi:hypothetical protein V1286_006096 [Bradyrhizobium algeriense]|uniref:Uncharacterized protein n=1 Tax=Bradyrhizobium algeriense TaxID=634784 RepID=A0ABU8BJ46_9BRAD
MDDREAAEDYRRQRQNANARKHGDEPVHHQDAYDRQVLLEAARRAGANEQEIDAVADHYLRILSAMPQGSAFDYPGAIQILGNLIHRVEAACDNLKIPIRGGVVFGNTAGAGPIASQMAVMQTDMSIIEVTLPFLVFCNLVSKALAHTVPEPLGDLAEYKLTFDLELIRQRLTQENRKNSYLSRPTSGHATCSSNLSPT